MSALKIRLKKLRQNLCCLKRCVNIVLNKAKERFAAAVDEIIKDKFDETKIYD